MGYTEKQTDKFSREMERDLHRKLEKVEKAPVSEQAVVQLEAAKKLLRNTESGSNLVPTEEVINSKPEYKSDVSPEEAERIFKQTTDNFVKGLDENAHLNPEAAKKIRHDYGLKNRESRNGRGKVWSVGINLSKKE